MSLKELADVIVQQTEQRILGKLGNAAFLNYRFGTVTCVTGYTASVTFPNSTVPISGVKYPSGTLVTPGMTVRVAMDPSGDAFITEVY